MTPQSVLSEAVLLSKSLTARYLAGFDDSNHTTQAPGLPNHTAWCLGHCAFIMHRIAEVIERDLSSLPDVPMIPESEFLPGDVGDRSRFAIEAVAFKSDPVDDASLYPPMARCVEIYNSACDRLAAAARAAPDTSLSRAITWGALQTTAFAIILRMLFHNGFHAGQIADLRRVLGFKSIFA
ncbi:MAG: DinB family protein [Phycisphaeraceae bacterium]|nr:DinB family protein [Phycisphaeraceae bacterium]